MSKGILKTSKKSKKTTFSIDRIYQKGYSMSKKGYSMSKKGYSMSKKGYSMSKKGYSMSKELL